MIRSTICEDSNAYPRLVSMSTAEYFSLELDLLLTSTHLDFTLETFELSVFPKPSLEKFGLAQI